MKQVLTLILGFGMLLTVQQAFGKGGANHIEAEELTPQEAVTLAYLWEQEKHMRDIFLSGTTCSSSAEVANLVIAEQEHMDILKGLLNHYGLDVPVPGEEQGEFTDSFLGTMIAWFSWSEACLRPPGSIYVVALMYEDMATWNLIQAIDQSDNQLLLDAYHQLLDDSCANLRWLLPLPEWDWEPMYLSQDLLDQILAGTFPATVDEGFTINPGLNDAWYYPGTDGQGFFVSVFPDLGTISLAWFTYDTELPGPDASANLGDPGQRWFIAHGTYEGDQANLEILNFSGGLFDTELYAPIYEAVGSLILRFEDCNSGSISYDLPAISRSGVIPIERVAVDNVPVCEAYQEQ